MIDAFIINRVVLRDLFQRGRTLSLWRNHLFFSSPKLPQKRRTLGGRSELGGRSCERTLNKKQDARRERASEDELISRRHDATINKFSFFLLGDTMGKATRRRLLTGLIRRGPKRNHSSYRRAMHLSHKDVGFCNFLQYYIAKSGSSSRLAMIQLAPLAILSFLCRNLGPV